LVQRAEAGEVLRVIVQAGDTDAALTLSAQASEHGATIVHQFDRFPLIVMEVNTSALQGLLASPLVVSLGEDGLLAPTLDNSLPVINAPEVHSLGGDGTGVAVAILDTGIDRNHPFFGDRVVEEACYSNSAGSDGGVSLCPNGETSQTGVGAASSNSSGCLNGTSNICIHGPHVAGIAAGDGAGVSGAPAAGVAPGADIIAIQVFTRYNTSERCNPSSAPCLRAWFSDLIRGMERVLELSETRTVAAVNMSLGGNFYTSACDAEYPSATTAINSLRAANIATIVASGNSKKADAISIPACISSAISVGSTNNSDSISSFSNRGPLLDLFAPGYGIRSAAANNGYGYKTGTSMAAPHVAGAWAVLRQMNPDLSVAGALTLLQETGKPITYSSGGTNITTPRIDLLAAVETAADYGEIRGFKWHDINGNGAWDAGEPPLADWEIYLDLNDNGQHDPDEPVAVTGADGAYAFLNVPPGEYVVREVEQLGYEQTFPGLNTGTFWASAYGANTDGKTQLAWIDADTGQVSRAAELMAQQMHGMVLTNDGHLFGIHGPDDSLYEIDPITGAVSLVGSSGWVLHWGLAYDPETDTIYGSGRTSSTDTVSHLLVFDRTDGSVTAVGPGMTGLGTVGGLTFDQANQRILLFSNDTNRFHAFDIQGNGTEVSVLSSGVNTWSLASYGDGVAMGLTGARNNEILFVNPDTGEHTGSLLLSEAAAAEALEFIPGDSYGHRIVVGSGAVVSDQNFGNWDSNEIMVTTFDDIIDPNDGLISLREAIRLANQSEQDLTIVLPAGTYPLSIPGIGEDTSLTGDLDILPGGSVTILGAGTGQTIIDASALNDRGFQVLSGGDLRIEGMSITGGATSGYGGAILNAGTLTLTHSVLSDASALNGGGLANEGGTATVISSTISGNATLGLRAAGGGIHNSGAAGTITVINSTISGNVATGNGGGIQNTGGATLTIDNSTVVNNRANTDGSDGFAGGGLHVFSGTATLRNTIVAGNRQGAGANDQPSDVVRRSEAGFSGTFSLIGDAESSGELVHGVDGNIVGVDWLGALDPHLQDNGGPTRTHAVLPGSPAIDAGDPTFDPDAFDLPLLYDQRGTGFPRVLGSRIDIGAVEYLPPPVEATRIDMTIVAQPSATGDNGEVISLPNSLDWVHEWQSFWVEIWLSTPDATMLGVVQATVDLQYAANYLTAQQIEYGPAFTQDQTGEILDASGRVSNLGARTDRTDVGDDGYVLLARVQFASTDGDDVPVDQAGWNIGPYNMDFVLANGQTQLVGDVTGAPELGSMPGTELWAVAYDMEDNHEIDFGDFSFFAPAFGRLVNQSNPEQPYTWWADFDKSGRVDFGDLAFFAPNFGKSREQVQAGTQVLSFPASFPAAWRGPAGPGDGGEAEGSNILAGSGFTPGEQDTPMNEAGAVDDWRGLADGEAAGPTGAGTSSVGVQAVAVQTPSPKNSKELPSGLESVARGSTYFVELWVQDRVEPGVGISGGTLDVNYATSLVQAEGLVNADFSLFSSGTIDAADGVVRNLGGGLLRSGLGVAPQWARLAYIEILAGSSGEASFQVSPGAGQFSRYGQGNVAWDLVDLGSPIVVQQIGGHWRNPSDPYDVNDDGLITPLDALVTINEINRNEIRELPVPDPTSQQPPPYFDVSGDDWLTAHDVLLVINYLNRHGSGPIPAGSGAAALAATAGTLDSGPAEGESPPALAIFDRISDFWFFADPQPTEHRYVQETDSVREAVGSDDFHFQGDFHEHRLPEVSPTATAQRTYAPSSDPQSLEDLLELLADRSMDGVLDNTLAVHDALFTQFGR
jgi:hypothetical protein